jgi:hypothetical protein
LSVFSKNDHSDPSFSRAERHHPRAPPRLHHYRAFWSSSQTVVKAFRPTLHCRSHHPISQPSPPPRRFPGLPSVISTAADDGSRGCSSRVGGEAQDQRGNGEEGHVGLVRMLGLRERQLFHGGGVGRGWGAWQPWRLFHVVFSRQPSLHPVSGPSCADRRYHLPLESTCYSTPFPPLMHRQSVVPTKVATGASLCHLLPR